jgi:hypothetical protein
MNCPKTLITIVVCSLSTLSALAQVSYSTDLQRLKDEHQKSVQAAVEPLNRRYGVDLESLLRKATQSGDLDTALKVREEMKALGVSAPQPASGSATIDSRQALIGKWEYFAQGWHDQREFKADGSVQIVAGGKAGSKGKWTLQGNKVIVRWTGKTDTVQLPDVNDTLKGTTDHVEYDPKHGGEFTMKRSTE